jgi:hypothetical protein
MFCPVCKDEFRPGFTRCAACGVDLVDRLDPSGTSPESTREARKPSAGPVYVPLAEYCGFVSLEESRDARDRLKAAGIRSEIAIRESMESFSGSTVEEEYWLRVERDRYREVVNLLGFDVADHADDDGSFACGECGTEVAAEESFCPKCGARFEDD